MNEGARHGGNNLRGVHRFLGWRQHGEVVQTGNREKGKYPRIHPTSRSIRDRIIRPVGPTDAVLSPLQSLFVSLDVRLLLSVCPPRCLISFERTLGQCAIPESVSLLRRTSQVCSAA